MATDNYGLHTIDYGVTGWDAIMTTDMEIIDQAMYDNKELTVRLLGLSTINGQTTTKQTIFTVPSSKIMIPHMIKIYTVSATLAGLVDADFGGDASAGDWIQQVTLAGLTGTTHQTVILQPEQAAGPPIVPVQKIAYAAAIAFGIKINTGSTGAATFTAALFGHLADA